MSKKKREKKSVAWSVQKNLRLEGFSSEFIVM